MISAKRILIVRPDRLGDLILSLPVAESLKINLPDTDVIYLVSPYTMGIFPMVDYVDGVLMDVNNDGGKAGIRFLSEKIRYMNIDCIIELRPTWRTTIAGAKAGVKYRIGTSRRAYSVFYTNRISIHRRSSGCHQTDLELKHLKPFGFETLITDPKLHTTTEGLRKAKMLLNMEDKEYIVLHPGSGHSSPNWPVEFYLELAAMIRNNLKYEVVITNRDNRMRGFDKYLDLGGKTDLQTLAGVIKGAALFVSGSTGPLHMADALGVKCLSFFVNRSDIGPVRWGPRRNLENVLMPNDECRCADSGSCRCLERVSPDYAFNRLKAILDLKANFGVEQK